MHITCPFSFADAGWESFTNKTEVSSANQEHMIQKTLQNIHWERKPRVREPDEDDWDRRRRQERCAVVSDEEEEKDDDFGDAQYAVQRTSTSAARTASQSSTTLSLGGVQCTSSGARRSPKFSSFVSQTVVD